MQYKHLCTNVDWLPIEGGGIRLWIETADGQPMVPSGNLLLLAPQRGRCYDEVCKGINGFLSLWGTITNENLSGEFRRMNKPLSYYWRGVRSALNTPLLAPESLGNGFWPSSKYALEEEDQYLNNNLMQEEYVEDAPFVGRCRDRPVPSFWIAHDMYTGYLIAVRPADEDFRLFWLARAFTNPNPDLGHVNSIQIQYWKPASSQHINIETYFI